MKKLLILFCLILSLLPVGCTNSQIATAEFFAMDTVMQITLYENNDPLVAQAKQKVADLEATLSVTKPSSEINKINQANGQPVTISKETAQLLQTAKALKGETQGLFDITVYPAVKAWGFTQSQNRVPSARELNQILPFIDCNKLQIEGTTVTLPQGMLVDLGGIAKGYAADTVAQFLLENNCPGGVLSFGGNVKTFGTKPGGGLFQIAVQDPHNSSKTVGTLTVAGNTAVVTSGDTQRFFEQDGVTYHHTIHPNTAAPAQSDVSAVTVVCSSATRADAFATALYIMGLEEGLAFANQASDTEALFITKDGTVHVTQGLQNSFTPEKQ